MKRDEILIKLKNEVFDVLVIGGGINGAISAAALSAKGLNVALIDKGDFGSFTSQESSNLVWGGIKYLENFELFLVRKLCMSRNHLISSYPSIVKEIRFLVPHKKDFKHGLLKLYLGTFFYWFMGNFFTKIPKFYSLKKIAKEEAMIDLKGCNGGFEYSDAFLEESDARFVFMFVREALKNKAKALNYIEAIKSIRDKNGFANTEVKDNHNNEKFIVRSRAIINATGPYVDKINEVNGIETDHKHVLSKGIHLIVNKIPKNHRVFTFFADDERMFFVIPMGNRSCIGTTDTKIFDLPPKVDKDDIGFVLDNINKRLTLDRPLTEDDIISMRCGARPLVVKKSKKSEEDQHFLKLSRKHAIDVDKKNKYISIFGGKLTDCLNIGEEVIECIESLGIDLPEKTKKWYGEPPKYIKDNFLREFNELKMNEKDKVGLAEHLWSRYFEDAHKIIDIIKKNPPKAEKIIEGMHYIKAELDYMNENELILYKEDLLRRRTKLAMTLKDFSL